VYDSHGGTKEIRSALDLRSVGRERGNRSTRKEKEKEKEEEEEKGERKGIFPAVCKLALRVFYGF
jgi:hypothetical protein